MEGEEGETGTNIEGEDSLEGTTEGLDAVSEKEADLLNQLSPEEVKAIMTSVMEEMVQGLQVSLLSRIRKTHLCGILL